MDGSGDAAANILHRPARRSNLVIVVSEKMSEVLEAGLRWEHVWELIEQAGLGLVEWDAVSSGVAAAFPGSYAAVASQQNATGKANFVAVSGMDPRSQRDYFSYYSTINPWNSVFQRMRPGTILNSEKTCPVSAFTNTEFVNDWLAPQQKDSVGIGMKLDATAQDELFLAVHFERRYIDQYEHAMLEAFNQLAPRLRRTLELHSRLSKQFGESIAAAAIAARTESAAFVVDEWGHLVDANGAASTTLASGDVLRAVPSGVAFQDTAMQNWFLHTVQALIAGRPVGSSSRLLASANTIWRLSLTRVPETDPRNGNRFFLPRYLCLAILDDAKRPPAEDLDVEALKSLGLIQSEIRLCIELARGRTLYEAADSLTITKETARQRLKSIFSKTGVSRQGDLVLLLSRLAEKRP
jgi:DNA-binding CsgD family transcriptional regulator